MIEFRVTRQVDYWKSGGKIEITLESEDGRTIFVDMKSREELQQYPVGSKFALLPMAVEISPVGVATIVERTMEIGERNQ